MSVNIPSTVTDPNHRYTMPRISLKPEGSGNGVKTNFVNMRDVCFALKRNPQYATKHFSKDLGCRATYHANEGKTIMTGAYTEDQMAKSLDKFIHDFVICHKCQLPEMDLLVVGSKLNSRCNGCGESGTLPSADPVAKFIIKNPPEGSTVVQEAVVALVDSAKVADKPKKEETKIKVKKRVRKEGKPKEVLPHSESWNEYLRRLILARIADPLTLVDEARAMQLTTGFAPAWRECIFLAALYLPDSVGTAEGEVECINLCPNAFEEKLSVIISKGSAAEEIISGLECFVKHYIPADQFGKTYPFLLKSLYDSGLVRREDIQEYYDESEVPVCAVARESCLAVVGPFLKWLDASESYYEDSDDSSIE